MELVTCLVPNWCKNIGVLPWCRRLTANNSGIIPAFQMVVATRQDNINCMLHGQFVWHIPWKIIGHDWSLLWLLCVNGVRSDCLIWYPWENMNWNIWKRRRNTTTTTHMQNTWKIKVKKYQASFQNSWNKNSNKKKRKFFEISSEFLTLVDMFFSFFPPVASPVVFFFADPTALNRLHPWKKCWYFWRFNVFTMMTWYDN